MYNEKSPVDFSPQMWQSWRMDLAMRDNIRVTAIAAAMVSAGVFAGDRLAGNLEVSATTYGILVVAGYVLGMLTTTAIVVELDRRREELAGTERH